MTLQDARRQNPNKIAGHSCLKSSFDREDNDPNKAEFEIHPKTVDESLEASARRTRIALQQYSHTWGMQAAIDDDH